ncbi:iron-containing alcohol dehydrogenase family protein [Peptoniphilus ovalis]|nr:iron-containing alcohol dehydrogenase family protein [Peptoniphilus ovalis]
MIKNLFKGRRVIIMRTMKLTNYSLSESGYDGLTEILKGYKYDSVVLVGGKRALNAVSSKIRKELENSDININGEFIYGKECTDENIEKLMEKDEIKNADVIFAIGGGKSIDTCKALAKFLNKPCISFPTICSNCSSSTSVAVVYNEDGSLKRYETVEAPVHNFIEIETIVNAPYEYFWAGIGDGLSKQSEVLFSSRGEDLDYIAKMGISIAKSCDYPFFEYGEKALEDFKNNKITRAVTEIVIDICINTGYTSNLTDQEDYYYNSSLAHAFYNASTSVKREGTYLHGQVVSFGTLVLKAYDEDSKGLEKFAKFNKKLSLPVTLSDIGLKIEDLDIMMPKVVATQEWQVSKDKLSEDKFIEAVKKADEFGKTLK